MLLTSWIQSLRRTLQTNRSWQSKRPLTRAAYHKRRTAPTAVERLEDRTLLASPTLVSVTANFGDFIEDGQVRHDSPRDLVFQFSPGQEIDADTLDGIRFTRAGFDDQFEVAFARTDFNTGGAVVVNFEAQEIGDAGNGVTLSVTHSDHGGPSFPIVNVAGSTVTVDLNSNPGNENTVGDLVDAVNGDAAASALLTASIESGSDAVDIITPAFRRASAVSDLNTGGAVEITFTAAQAGENGNAVSVVVTKSDHGGAGAPTVAVNGSLVTVDLNTNAASPSTAADLVDAVNNDAAASAVVSAAVTAGDEETDVASSAISNSQFDLGGAKDVFPLVLGGADSATASTDLNAAAPLEIQFTSAVSGAVGNGVSIVFTKSDHGGPGGPTITVDGETVTVDLNTNPGNETTARQLVDAINADPDASALVRAALPIGSPETDVATGAVDGTTLVLDGVDDVVVTPGFIGIGEETNEVIVRFSEMLPDDLYRIDILGSGATPVKNVEGDVFNSGVNVAIDFEIDLGAQVVAVVPQPVTRNATGQLDQAHNQVVVYFNNDDLDAALAEDPKFYQLINVDTEVIMLPSDVVYDSDRNVATLDFGADIPDGTYRLQVGESDESNKTLATAVNAGTQFDSTDYSKTAFLGDEDATNDVDLYRFDVLSTATLTATVAASASLNTHVRLFDANGNELADDDAGGVGGTDTIVRLLGAGTYYIGISGSGNTGYNASDGSLIGNFGVGGTGSYTLSLDATTSISGSDDNSSFGTATPLGNLGAAEQSFSANISPQNVLFPVYPGGNDEPGHRHIPPEDHGAGSGTGSSIPGPITVIQYNFKDNYGTVLGQPVQNAITENQKQRAREIFEIYGYYLGVKFVETASFGLTVATGDPRAVDSSIPPGTVGGIANGSIALMDAFHNWGNSEYGGSWFNTAMHEIGHSIGLGHSYDIPSIQGAGITGEPVFPGDHDLVHHLRNHRPDSTDIDLYQFEVTEAGWFSAETVAERRAEFSHLDTVLTLYRERTTPDGIVREMVARNDDFYSNDSFIGIELEPGLYYVAVTSTGNANFDPTVSDSGFGGTSDGEYDLKLDFQPAARSSLLDATDNRFDGDADGAEGAVYNFWFQSGDTIFVDKAAEDGGNGSEAAPYNRISDAVQDIENGGTADIIRIVGNGGADGDVSTIEDNAPYILGLNDFFVPHADGVDFEVPQGVTVMIDAGALLKLESAIIDVGNLPQTGDRSEGALQVLGTPEQRVYFTSVGDDSKGGDSDGLPIGPRAGDWGGLVFRDNSDLEDEGVFLNYVNHADLAYGGGKVTAGSIEDVYTPIHMVEARPTVSFNRITNSAGAALSADPNSFDDADGRIGPDIYGNSIVDNSINGLFIRIRVESNVPVDTLDVGARWDDLDVVHVVTENLHISGTPGGPVNTMARLNGRLKIDPGVVVKLSNARIEATVGGSQLIAEGTESLPIIFTSLLDDRFGAGSTFDTNGDGANSTPAPGQWGGLMFDAVSRGSIDYAYIAFGGGDVPFETGEDDMNVIEVHQADFRLTNSIIEHNAANTSTTNRHGRGFNGTATIFVRGAQPVIVDNLIRHNAGNMISINANALQSRIVTDWGRSSGPIEQYSQFDDNYGPLVRLNRIWNNGTNGMEVRGGELTTETVWDDTDIVHVLRNEIVINNHHTYSGLRLQSSATEGLVVKLDGTNAGFTANGVPLDIDDRIGGTIHIVGQPDFPVVLTSLADDSIGASFDPEGRPHYDTNNNGAATSPQPGDWRSVRLDRYSNDRNVALVQEEERSHTDGTDTNGDPGHGQFLGELAPNEKSGDDNHRLGFEVHGFISPDDPTDLDVYSFTGIAGTEVWIDIDRTDSSLDTVVELINGLGTVLARSTSNGAVQFFGTSGGTLMKDSWLGGDFYTLNPRDAGMRVTLPGIPGVEGTFYVRVRSNPAQISDLNGGRTSGKYELEVRLRQVDEKPGSNVLYSDIRYATNGIEVFGLPGHSPLVGESGEAAGDNNGLSNAQPLGNLLTTDRNTISVGGSLSSSTDVDWYQFELGFDLIQAIGGVNGGGKTWATIFDVDYADGLARPDTVISVFDSSGRLILVSRDSNIEDDQPGAGEGLDSDDLSRGSFGKLDPFIGSVQMPASPPGNTNVYYVAISSNARLPEALNATFTAGALNPLIRLEPVNSVERLIEDHIGFTGYRSGTSLTGTVNVNPTSGPLFNIDSGNQLSLHVREFSLADVVLFVSQSNRLRTIDPFHGGIASNGGSNTDVGPISGGNNGIQDIVMRSDGRLFGYESLGGGVANTAGRMVEIDWETAGLTPVGNDSIPDFNMNTNPPDPNQITTDLVDAVAIGRTDVAEYDNVYLSVGDGTTSRLYQANPGNNSAAAAMNQPWGIKGEITGPGVSGRTTGMAFVNGILYGVSSNGQFYRINIGSGAATLIADFGTGFAGLTNGPQNLYGGDYADLLFAIRTDGRLTAFNTVGTLQGIFANEATSVATGVGSPTGLAFSPLDFNLWHPTMRRNTNPGHGINAAFDNSRNGPSGLTRNVGPNNLNHTEAQGGASFYFGLESWHDQPNSTRSEYFTYGVNGQFGVMNSHGYDFQRDLTTNAVIGDNYNLPGGAHGSLITSTFSLEDYDRTDKPTLYFNYFLETEGRNDKNNRNMRDSARVFITPDGGNTWHLVATNNSELSSPGTTNGELPAYLTASRDAAPHSNQDVQELFDTGDWRQARIDLAEFAGAPNLMLRFDFATAGRTPDDLVLNNPSEGANDFGNLNSEQRGEDNNHEGFYIDDIIIGFAERGEMVTGAVAGQTDFFGLPQNPTFGDPQQSLVGPYQFEIRRGTEYGEIIIPVLSDIHIIDQFDTNTRMIRELGRLGDRNLHREQGQLQIDSNSISHVEEYGIIVDAGQRDGGTNFAHPGSTINHPTLNNQRLVPGVKIVNNVVSNFNDGGIFFSGDSNSGNVPTAVVPYGRIVNNTIYGGESAQGTGITVTQNAHPTILNNIIVNTDTGIAVDGTSNGVGETVISNNLFRGNGNDGTTGADPVFPLPSDPLFVNPLAGNFYLAAGAPAIDRSLNNMSDRPNLLAVKSPLGIPGSNIIAPSQDRFGQLRVDDPDEDPTGSGAEIFKDLGGIERADFSRPTSVLVVPEDNDLEGVDLEPTATIVWVDDPQLLTTFVVELRDIGIGIDDLSVVSERFELQQSGTVLTDGVDYLFAYNANTNQASFTAVAGVFPLDNRYTITIDNSESTGVKDLAANPIAANQVDGSTMFTIVVTDGDNDPPVNVVPTLPQSTDEDVPLVFSDATGNTVAVTDTDAFLGDGEVEVTLTATNGTLTLSTTTDLTFSTGDGTDDDAMTFIGKIADVNAALAGMFFLSPQDYFGPGSVTMVTNDLGNFGPPGSTPQSDSDTIVINVNAVNDPPVNTLPATDETDENVDLVFSTANGNGISISDVDADGGMMLMTLTAENGRLTLPSTAGLTFVDVDGVPETNVDNDGTDDVVLRFTGTIADINAALEGLVFTPDLNFVGMASVTVDTNDQGNSGSGGAQSDVDTIDITVHPVNKLFIDDAEIVEGDMGQTMLAFNVRMFLPTTLPVSVQVDTADGTATAADGDFQSVSQIITFNPGESQVQQVLIPINGDAKVELDETFFVNLSNGSVEIRDGQAIGTIENDDATTLSIADVTQLEDTSDFVFTVTLNGEVDAPVTVEYATVELADEAIAGTDYETTSGMLTFDGTAGEPETFIVTVTADTLIELDELFAADIFNVNAMGRDVTIDVAQGVATIDDDDQATISVDSVEANEDTGELTFTVTLTGDVDAPVTVDYATADLPGQAVDGEDYTGTSGTLMFDGTSGQSHEITVALTPDAIAELDETFALDLSNIQAGGRDVVLNPAQGIGTILNDDGATLTVDSISALEDTGVFEFTVTLVGDVDVPFTVDFVTADIPGEAVAGEDYDATTGTLNFQGFNGETQKFTIAVTPDTLVELNQTFAVDLVNVQAAGRPVTVSPDMGRGIATIIDDDEATVAVDNISHEEDTGVFTFTVTLTGDVDAPFTVDYATADVAGQAVAGVDYEATSGTLTFDNPSNGATESFTVSVFADSLVELDEMFSAVLSNVDAGGRNVNIEPGLGEGFATIRNDDEATIRVNSVSGDEGDGFLEFTATLEGEVDAPFTVDFTTQEIMDAAILGVDFIPTTGTLLFSGFDGEQQTFAITIVDDLLVELEEDFEVVLGNVQAGGRNVIADATPGVGTIVDNDVATLRVNSVEGDENSGNLTFVVTLEGDVDAPFTVDFATADILGEAVAGVDYTANSGTLNFEGEDGEIQTFTVAMTADAIVELDESFDVSIGNVQAGGRNVQADATPGVGTILNDDRAFLSIDSVGALEDDGELTFTVTLDGAVDVGFDVNATTSDLSGEAVAGADYTARSSKLSFVGNDRETQTFTVSLTPDSVFEFDELFHATLSNLQASGRDVSIAIGQGTGTIFNDDEATLTVSNVSGSEKGGPLTFAVELDGEVAFPFSVDFATADVLNQAVGGVDYVQNIGTLNFSGADGETRTFNINAIDDIVVELDEQFRVDLRNIRSGGRLVDLTTVSGHGTIVNDDSATLSIANVSADEDSGLMQFTVSLFGALDTPFTVNYTTNEIPGGATTGVDFAPGIGTVSFTGSLNQTRSIDITLFADGEFEPDEALEVLLSNLQAGGRNITIARTAAIGQIINDDAPLAPTLLAPEQSENVPDTTPTFQWTSEVGADRYDVWVNDLTTGVSGVIRNQAVPAAAENGVVSYTDATELTVGHIYIWTVRGIRADGLPGNWASHRVFRVIEQPIITDNSITPPVILTPTGGVVEEPGTNNVKFEWEPVPQAVRYDIWVNNLTTRESGVIRNLHVTETSLEATLPIGSYIWTVRAITDSGTASEFAPHARFSVGGTLAAPTLLSPIGEVVDTTPTFSWTAVNGAARYDLWVNNRTTGQVGVIRNTQITGTSFTPTTPLPNGDYIWTVRAISANGTEGKWGAHRTFQVNSQTLAAPKILGPTGVTAVNPPVFTWTAVVGAARYDIWVNDLTTGQSAVIRNTHVQGTTYTGQSLTRGHSYIWTVRAIDDAGNEGHWAGHRIFTVVQAGSFETGTLVDPKTADGQESESEMIDKSETATSQDVLVVTTDSGTFDAELETTVAATHDFAAAVAGDKNAAPFASVTILAETRGAERGANAGDMEITSRAASDVMSQWHLEDWWNQSREQMNDEAFARADEVDGGADDSERRPALFGKLLASASPFLFGRAARRSRKRNRRTES